MELGDIINFLLIIAFAVVAPIIGAVSKRNKSKQQADKAATGANDSFVRDMEKASEQEMESAEHAVLDNHNLQNDGSGLSYQNTAILPILGKPVIKWLNSRKNQQSRM